MMRSHDPLPPDLQVRANIARLHAGRNGKPNHETTPTTPSTPIFGELPTAPPFPVDALPVATRRFVREAAAAIGCPPEMIAVPLLGTLSAGIGASRVVQLKRGWQEGATLFLAVVARPGTKKTPAAKAATGPVWKRQAELRRRYSDERELYEAECRQWKDESREVFEDEEFEDEEPAPGPEPLLTPPDSLGVSPGQPSEIAQCLRCNLGMSGIDRLLVSLLCQLVLT